MSWLTKLFKRASKTPSESGKNWLEGRKAFDAGYKHYENNFFEKALPFFDIAIKFEYNLYDAYMCRANCLESLNFHLDAIEDFGKAIMLSPDDCNLYFMRSLSKASIYDCEGQVSDLEKAIELSKISNELNQEYLISAKEMGHDSHTSMYQKDLIGAKMRIERNVCNELREHSKGTKNIYKQRSDKNL